MPACVHRTLRVCVLGFTLTHSGCVALNLPSERFHDPSDRGGIFGAWKAPGKGHGVNQSLDSSVTLDPNVSLGPNAPPGQHSPPCQDCWGGGDLPHDPFDTEHGQYADPTPPPEVPWPRFHPLPTRPIFGG